MLSFGCCFLFFLDPCRLCPALLAADRVGWHLARQVADPPVLGQFRGGRRAEVGGGSALELRAAEVVAVCRNLRWELISFSPDILGYTAGHPLLRAAKFGFPELHGDGRPRNTCGCRIQSIRAKTTGTVAVEQWMSGRGDRRTTIEAMGKSKQKEWELGRLRMEKCMTKGRWPNRRDIRTFVRERRKRVRIQTN